MLELWNNNISAKMVLLGVFFLTMAMGFSAHAQDDSSSVSESSFSASLTEINDNLGNGGSLGGLGNNGSELGSSTPPSVLSVPVNQQTISPTNINSGLTISPPVYTTQATATVSTVSTANWAAFAVSLTPVNPPATPTKGPLEDAGINISAVEDVPGLEAAIDALSPQTLQITVPGQIPLGTTSFNGVTLPAGPLLPILQNGLANGYVVWGPQATLNQVVLNSVTDAGALSSPVTPNQPYGQQISFIPSDANSKNESTQNWTWHELFWNGAKFSYGEAVADAVALVGNGCPCAKAALDYKAAFEAISNTNTRMLYSQALGPSLKIKSIATLYDPDYANGGLPSAASPNAVINNGFEAFNYLNNPYQAINAYPGINNDYGQWLMKFISKTNKNTQAATAEANNITNAILNSAVNQQLVNALGAFPAQVMSGGTKAQGAPF